MTGAADAHATDDPLLASIRHASELLVEGQVESASTIFRRVLAFEPRQHDAFHLLGVARHRAGDLAGSVRLIGRAITLAGATRGFLDNLRVILRSQTPEPIDTRLTAGASGTVAGLVWAAVGDAALRRRKSTASITAFRRSIALSPSDEVTLNGLGCALEAGADHRASSVVLQRGLTVDPLSVDLRFNLASVRIAADRHRDAAIEARIAAALSPGLVEAYLALGTACRKLGRLKEAIAAFDRGAGLSPASPAVLIGRAAVLAELRSYDRAARDLRRSIAVEPSQSEASYNLARVHVDRHRYDLAAGFFRRTLAIDPMHRDSRVTLGVCLHALGRPLEALACYRRVQALYPDKVGARWNEAQVMFDLGDLASAWKKHELRFSALGGERRLSLRQWRGESLPAGRLLVWAEQGIGDELIFASVFRDVLAWTSRPVFECDGRLLTLFRRSFPEADFCVRNDAAALQAASAAATHHIPAGSLPLLFRSQLEAFPDHAGFLRADAEMIADWRRRLDAFGPGRKIGISWRSQSILPHREPFMMTIDEIVRAASVEGATLVNLQYDDCRDELAQLESGTGIRVMNFPGLDQKNEIDRVAALICGLDAVVSAGTSVAALTGALGVPLWQFSTYPSPFDALGTGHTPWFPRVRFIERRWPSDWTETIERIRRELGESIGPRVSREARP